jgi:peptidoglycan/xylan/chitin deacetylase (PgdA/CDA1 family)
MEEHYYHSLPAFEAFFQTGVPILTYHKVGPRPRGARLKGLYAAPQRFARQMDELAAAGYQSLRLENAAAHKTGERRVVISFDDGFVNVFDNALEALRRNRFQAVQFLVADFLGRTNEWDVKLGDVSEPLMDAGRVREWLSAGHSIGAHTLSHAHLTQLSPEDARREIADSKARLEDLFGVPIEHFCYPYGDWNPAVRDYVIQAGYKTACTTAFGINEPGCDPFSLKRITVRYPSRSLKALIGRIKAVFKQN